MNKFFILSVLFLFILGAGTGCVMTQEDAEKLAQDIRAIESSVVDAIPAPIPKDATKEMLGWISDLIILGGGAGAAGIGGKKLLNGKGKNGKTK